MGPDEIKRLRDLTLSLRLDAYHGSTKHSWTDQYIIDETKKIRVENVWENNDLIKRILVRFWSFYITGRLSGDSKSSDVIGNAVLLALDPSSSKERVKFLFKDLLISNESNAGSQYTNPRNVASNSGIGFRPMFIKPKAEIKVERFLPDDEKYDWAYGGRTRFESTYLDNCYDKFARHVGMTLRSWNVMASIPQDVLDLMKLTSVVSLMTFRAVIREQHALGNAFSDENLFDNIKALMKFSGSVFYVPPCQEFINKAVLALNKSKSYESFRFKDFFMMMVARYAIEQRKGSQGSSAVIQLLIFTCLKETAYNGLVLINLLYTCCNHLGVTIEKFFSLVSNIDDYSVDKIRTYCNDCLQKTNYQYSSPWCRLLKDDDYYADLKYDRGHTRITAVMAGIIESAEKNSAIWNTTWGKKVQFYFEERGLGAKIYQNAKSRSLRAESKYLILIP